MSDHVDQGEGASQRYQSFAAFYPFYIQEHRSYLTVAIGCTGGQHRSVWCAQELATRFRRTEHVLVRHRGLALRGRTV